MAVTQQLARVSAEYLAACRRSAEESPDGDPGWDRPPADVLDLDWAAAALLRTRERAGPDDLQLNALRDATSGDPNVDVGYLNTHPHAIGPFGPAATAVTPVQVTRISDLLADIDLPSLLATRPADGPDLTARTVDRAYGSGGASEAYLLEHLDALRAFYREASRRRLHIVLWWD
ncbi:YfbM family protein [Streptomyces bambusae]|uniref:YfbM family protein n=1 Tax=Streptomyces bambusae TaxID=1550616 RepID=UPI001CFC9EFD|nr:YfbM family protein [Streptomyces bambusae]MCB5166515.1 YfbM family protein [Streptomyces bambusae]